MSVTMTRGEDWVWGFSVYDRESSVSTIEIDRHRVIAVCAHASLGMLLEHARILTPRDCPDRGAVGVGVGKANAFLDCHAQGILERHAHHIGNYYFVLVHVLRVEPDSLACTPSWSRTIRTFRAYSYPRRARHRVSLSH